MQVNNDQERRAVESSLSAHCLIGLGANLGEREHTLQSAINALRNDQDIDHLIASGFHETAPIGGPSGQPPFLNAAASFQTPLSPEDLLTKLQALETTLGRKRGERWAARTIDLDLLLFGDQAIDTQSLIVPHPWLPFRRFVLEPATEVAGEMIHSTTGHSIAELLSRLDRRPLRIAMGSGADRLRSEFVAILSSSLESAALTLVDDTADPDKAVVRVAVATSAGECEAVRSPVPTLVFPNDDSEAKAEFSALVGAISDHPRRLPDSDT